MAAKIKTEKSPFNPKLGVSPEGTLLDFKADLLAEFGFAYERFLDFEKEPHAHDRFVICTARVGAEFEVKDEKTGKKYVCNKTNFIFKTPRVEHSLRTMKTVYDNIVFLPTEKRLKKTFVSMGYDSDSWDLLLSGRIRTPNRSEWLDMLAERYLARRLFSSNKMLESLEEEILAEALEIVLGKPGAEKASTKSLTPVIGRVLELIEASLFSELDVDGVAKAAGLSRATLLRLFKSELETSPMAYVRSRRLEEAKNLLAKKKHSVTEVSYLVGYEDTSAFCRAYKAKFGVAPQSKV